MKATKHIRRLLKDLQELADSSMAEADGEDRAQDKELPAEDINLSSATTSEPGDSKTTPMASSSSETDTSTPSESFASKVLHDEVQRLVRQLGDSRVLVATLQAEIEMVRLEKEEDHQNDHLTIQRLEAELTRLEQQAQVDMAGLKKRQQEIELEIPAMEQQSKCLKEVLHDLNVSEPLYEELLAIPEDKRSLKAHLQILAYEKLKAFREEIEALRKERDNSREYLGRQNEEVERMQREVQRISAAAAIAKRDLDKEMSAVAARNERLEAELREALVKVEVLSAKGSMYDEVKEKLDKAEGSIIDAENSKAVMTATLQVVTDEKQRLLEVIKDKDHCLDLLSMDKIYLSREVKAHLDQVKKLEQELEHQQEKLRSLKNTRQELYNRVLSDSRDTQAAHEQRLQAKLARLQERANQDIEHIRKEATEVADEKVKTFREMRDAALSEAERLQANLRESKSVHDELLTKYHEHLRVSEAKEIETRSLIKVRDFELEQLRVAQQEIKCTMNQKSIENEALAEKVKILTEKFHIYEMESEKSAFLLRNELEMARRKLKKYESQALGLRNPSTEDGGGGLQNHDVACTSGEKVGPDCLTVVKRSASAQTSGRISPREHAQKVALKQVYTLSVTQNNEKKVLAVGQSLPTLQNATENERRDDQHDCQRLHRLQLDLRRILESRGTLENFQNLLKEKGIHISDSVLKKITRAKGSETTT
ncbi:progesterone-induced-blocking factor 1 [Marchantia polymorpha subsp. ruderalis]